MRLGSAWATLVVAGLSLALGAACGGQEAADRSARDAADAAKEVADTLEGNVEESVRLEEEEYDAARKEGQGRVEAASDAYDAVLDAGKD